VLLVTMPQIRPDIELQRKSGEGCRIEDAKKGRGDIHMTQEGFELSASQPENSVSVGTFPSKRSIVVY